MSGRNPNLHPGAPTPAAPNPAAVQNQAAAVAAQNTATENALAARTVSHTNVEGGVLHTPANDNWPVVGSSNTGFVPAGAMGVVAQEGHAPSVSQLTPAHLAAVTSALNALREAMRAIGVPC
jgi:hypothetical protein